MSDRGAGSIRLGFWAVVLLSVFAWAPTTYPGYWEATEGFRPVFNAIRPAAIAGVATNADLWRGTGSAAYLIAQPLMLLGLSPVAAVRTTFAVAFILGGLGMYIWLHERWGDRAAGLSALLFMLWPPLLATVYVRGSLSDALLLGLLPLAFAGVAVYAQYHSPSALVVIAISLFWMWRTQPGLAVVATVLLAAYVLAVERSRIAALVVGLSAAAGFSSLLPLWSIHSAPPVNFFDHFVYPHQLVYGNWTVAPSIAGWQDLYPFQLGIGVITFGVMALWLWFVQRTEWRGTELARLLAFSTIATLVFVLFSLPISAPLWRAIGADRLFTYPWQPLLLAGPLLALLAGSLPKLSDDLAKPALWSVLIALVVLGSLPSLTTEFTQVQPPDAPFAVYGAGPDIVVLDAKITEDADENVTELEVTWQAVEPLHFDYNVFFQALADTPEGTEVVAQLDEQPLQGERPATTWSPGDIFTDTYSLQLPDTVHLAEASGDAKPGLQQGVHGLEYYFGYYDWRDGSRLPVDGGIDDKLILYGE